MSTPAPSLGFRDVLKTPAVKRLWLAQAVSIFGDFQAVFAVFAVVTFQMHGTATQVAGILIAFLSPMAFFGPLAGVYVDRWNVKATMVGSDLIRGVLALALLFVRDLWAIYAILFLLSTVSSFFFPAQSVALRTVSPPGGLLSANALMSQAQQVALIVSPAIAGLLVEGIGANSCFLFDSASFFYSAGMVMSVPIRREAGTAQVAASVLSSLGQGFRFIFSHAAISFVMISMASGMFAMRCFGALLSIWVRDILASDSRGFGLLNSLIGIGMIFGTQMLRGFAKRVSERHLVIYGVGGMGIGVLATAVFRHMAGTVFGMFALGFCAALIFVTSQTLLQHETPPEMLGRIMSSMMSLMAIAQVIALIVAGPVAQAAGIRNLYYGSAAVLFAIAGSGYAKLRRV